MTIKKKTEQKDIDSLVQENKTVEMPNVQNLKAKYQHVTLSEKKKMSREEMDRYLAYCRDRDKEIVEGIFRFFECPGGRLDFSYNLPYKGEPVVKYSMIDGHSYKIPYGVAKHLNDDCWYPEHEYMEGSSSLQAGIGPNHPQMFIKRKIHRCGFQSTDFMTLDSNNTAAQIATI